MYLSLRHHFIFIHVYKTAGTSITRALAQRASNRAESLALACAKRFRIFPNLYDYSPHVTAGILQKRLPVALFDRFFKFAFVRNPYDWQVSLYTYMLQDKNHRLHTTMRQLKDFREYVRLGFFKLHGTQKDFVTDSNGKIIVDFVGQFERLQEDFDEVCNQIGMRRFELPICNRSTHQSYQEYYDAETREILSDFFKEDLELFDYKF